MTDPTLTGGERPQLPPGFAYDRAGNAIQLPREAGTAIRGLRRALGGVGGIAGIALLIFLASAIPDGPDPGVYSSPEAYQAALASHQGSLMHILNRVVDAALGGAVAITFMGFCLLVAQPIIAPNLDEATDIMMRAHKGEEITEAQARVASGVFVGAGLRLLALMLPLLGFGLFL